MITQNMQWIPSRMFSKISMLMRSGQATKVPSLASTNCLLDEWNSGISPALNFLLQLMLGNLYLLKGNFSYEHQKNSSS